MRVQNLVALASARSARIELEPLAPACNVLLRLMVTMRHRLADVSVHTLAQMMYVHCFELASIWLNLVLVVRTFDGWVEHEVSPVDVSLLHLLDSFDDHPWLDQVYTDVEGWPRAELIDRVFLTVFDNAQKDLHLALLRLQS